MDLAALFHELNAPLTRRLERLVGDPRTAEDLRQETFARAWKSAPRDADRGHMRAWLHRTAHNLAIDELRRRRHRDWLPLVEELTPAHHDADPDERIAAREALERLSPHERLVLLLRFEGDLSHAEIGQLLDVSEEAARKRVARARAAFAAAHRQVIPRERPVVLILLGDDVFAPYDRWIRAAGGEPRALDGRHFERQLASADALVVTGSHTDVHPGLYGEPNRSSVGDLDLERDRRDLGAIRAALAHDVPLVGVCRGHQLLNVAFGGTLYQDIDAERTASLCHEDHEHAIATGEGSLARRVVGRGGIVGSGHHQAAHRIGRGLRVTSGSPDGVVESLEVPRRRFAIGVQWHAERQLPEEPGARLAEALVKAAA